MSDEAVRDPSQGSVGLRRADDRRDVHVLEVGGRVGSLPRSLPVEPVWRNTEPWWLRFGVRPYLLLVDVLAFAVATVITRPTSPVHVLVLVVNVLTFAFAGLYRSRLSLSLLDDLPYIAGGVTIVGATLKVTLFGLLPNVNPPARQVVHALVLFLAVVVLRGIAYTVARQARCRGKVRHRTLIVGAGHVGVRPGEHPARRPQLRARPRRLHRLATPGASLGLPLPVLGGYDQLAQRIRDHTVRDVVVAFGGARESDLVDILPTCDRMDVQVFLIPRLFELHNASRYTDEVWGIPLMRVRRAVFRSPWWKVKRLIDVVVSGVALLVLSPLLAVIAVIARREGGPGVIFRQERVGADGRPFQVLKFRSLKPVDETESQTNWNIKHDDRLGPVGKFLRASSLDELPQLYNIFNGDMSLVGPRPERPHFVDQFSSQIPRYTACHRVPAGLTGWAQAHGLRGDTLIEDRARFDNYYIENWSLCSTRRS